MSLMPTMSTTLAMEQEPAEQPNTNWCCILSTFVVAGGLCFFGVSLALRGDGRTGLVLLLSSGGLLALSICAAIGKFRPRGEDKTVPTIPEDPEDQPPSYRLSWRRSFMRRVRNRNDGDVEGADDGARGGGERGRGWWRGKRVKGEEGGVRSQGNHSSRRGSDEDRHSSSCESLLAGLCGGGARGGLGEGYGPEGRCTQSLSNLLDPPSYQDAVAHLDDAAIRKLRSEMCLPSAISDIP